MSRRSTNRKAITSPSYQASEELYQALFEQAADGMFIADKQGCCIEVNRRGCEMLGYTREELLGLSMEDLIPAEDFARDPLQLDELRVGETLLKERRMRCKDGRLLPVEISAQMLADGRFLGIVRDISERRRVEEQLRESNERFRLLAESSLTGIYLIQENLFRYVNPAMARVFGYEVEEVTDKLGPMDLVYSDDRPLVAENIRRRIEGEVETIHYDFRGLRKDGSVIYVEVHGRRIEYGGKTGVIGTLVDITERKQTEEALRHLNRELRAISDCNQVLIRAEDEQALLNDICRIVCHEAGYHMAWVGFVEYDEAKTVRLAAWAGIEDRYITAAKVSWANKARGHGPIGMAIRSGETICVQDIATDPRVAPWREDTLQYGHRSHIILPLKDENARTFGVLNIYSAEPNAFIPEEIRLLEELAGDLAFGITTLRIRAEHKKAEMQLLASEHLFRALVENSPDFIARYDREFRRVYVNPAIQKLFGKPTEDVLNKIPDDQSPVYAPQVYIDQLRQVIETATERAVEMPFRTAQGEMHWGHMRFVPEFGPDGQVASVLAIGRDIHEIKENERRFRMLAENFPDFIVRFDRNCRYTYVNPAVEKAFGLPAEAFLGKTLQVLPQRQKPEQNDALLALIRRTFDEGVANETEARWNTEMGERLFEIRHVPEKDATGNVVSVLGIAHDITERKQAEEAYRASISRFRELFNKAAIPLCFTSKKGGDALHINTQFEKTFGYSHEEIPTLNEWWQLAYPDPIYRERVIDTCATALQRAVDTESDIEPIEYRVTCKNGDIRTMVVYGGFIGDELLLTFFDITERKQAEQERLVHLHFFESMDRVNRAIQGTDDLDQMMSDVLNLALSIFECDRAVLVYPCDPEVPTWSSPMERTRPEYPGILELGQVVPIDPEVAGIFGILLNSSGPVRFGPESEYSLASDAEEGYGIKSFLGMALYPKVGSPWLFGLHQCSYPRIWTPEEERLFQEIGRRLADALTGLLAHRHLQESEEQYRLIAENTVDTISVFDLNLKPIYVSPSVLKLRGYTVEEAMSQSLDQVLTPESLQKAKKVFAEQLALEASGKADPARTTLLELEQYRKDGSTIWVELAASAIRDNNLQPTGILTVSRDITERKRAEEALRASEARFRTFVDHAADAFFLLNDQATILDVNRQACESLGYSRQELIGMSPLDFDPDIDRSFLEQVQARLAAGEMVTFNTRHRRKDGSVFPVEVSTRSFWQGECRFSVSLVRDISERKQVQEALTLFRSLIDHANDIIEVADPETGRFLDVNERACLAHGYTREEYLALTVPQINTVVSARSWQETVEELRRAGSFVRESQHRRKDGSIFPVEVNINYIRLDRDYILSVVRDITERKQAEEALRASEVRFRTLVEHAADAFFLHDERGTILDVNRQACESLGYSREELIGLPAYAFDVGLDRSFIDQLEPRLAAGEGIEFNTWHRRKDGSLFPVEVRGRPFWQGERRFSVSLARDITERKRAEEALRESEERLRQIASSLREVVWLRDVQTRQVLYVNPAFQELTGRTCESFYENRDIVIDAIHPDDKEGVIKALDQRFESIPFDKEHRIIHVDGSVRWVSSRSFPVRNKAGEVYRWASVMEDITERKQAEEALRASEERYRALYHENPSMFFTLDAEGVVISVNDFGASQLGYTKDELEGKPVLDIFFEEDKDSVREQFKTCMQNPWQVYHWQFRKVRKDGSLMWVEEFARAVNGPDGTVYVLVVCQDITERKQLEAENEQLTAQFYQAQRMESIGRLAGGIAHDFNNLLVPIIGYIDLNLTDLSPESRLYADLTQVRKAADRAADLTRQILAFSRQQVLELSLLDLNTIIDEFKKMLQRLIGENIELRTVLSPDLYPVKADKGQIEQTLMNLAINSRDAMPVGGKLTIETANVFLDETYVKKYASELAPGHYVMLAISDTGQGMDAETRKRIFDPFFTTKESGKGTGLGLATVFGIIKQHQGHIWVYSESGQGTTFKIYLPQVEDTIQTTITTPKEPLSIYGTETVLVAEDDQMVRNLVCETLEAHGYDVVEAQSPTDCLELAYSKDTIHLLLTDVIMPEMNGKELYQKITAIHPNSRVLYMSGYTNEVVVHHGILDEGINFLQKPFTVQNLIRKVREVLS